MIRCVPPSATTGRVPVNLTVAPRYVRLHRPTRLRPETRRARDRIVLLPKRHRHLVHGRGDVQKLTNGNVHMLVASIGHVHRRSLMRVIGKGRAVAQLTHQAVHIVDRCPIPNVQVEIPETNRVGAIPECVMPKVTPRLALSVPGQVTSTIPFTPPGSAVIVVVPPSVASVCSTGTPLTSTDTPVKATPRFVNVAEMLAVSATAAPEGPVEVRIGVRGPSSTEENGER